MFAARQLLTRSAGALRPSAVVAGRRAAVQVRERHQMMMMLPAVVYALLLAPAPTERARACLLADRFIGLTHTPTCPSTHQYTQPPTQVVRRNMGGHGAAAPATGWEGEVRKVLKEDWQVCV